jgi:putative cell wall-binding protein
MGEGGGGREREKKRKGGETRRETGRTLFEPFNDPAHSMAKVCVCEQYHYRNM